MSDYSVRIRYDGPALEGHSMDVNHLAPALLALGDTCKLANKKFNQDRASVRVLVNANIEQNCFEFNIQLILDLYEQAKLLLGNPDVVTAKEILEWLGIVETSIGTVGLIRLMRWLKGREISSSELVTQDGKDLVKITITGDNNTVMVTPQTLELLKDPKAVKSIQEVVKPVTQTGYESLEFEQNGEVTDKINKDDAKVIVEYEHEESAEEASQVVTAWLQVYSPVYDTDATTWRFSYGDIHVYMDISETDIEERAFERGGAMINDTYKVRLEITQTLTESGKLTNHYKILEVLDFKSRPNQPSEQAGLNFNDEQ